MYTLPTLEMLLSPLKQVPQLLDSKSLATSSNYYYPRRIFLSARDGLSPVLGLTAQLATGLTALRSTLALSLLAPSLSASVHTNRALATAYSHLPPE